MDMRENKVKAAERVLRTFVIGSAVLSFFRAFCLRLTDIVVLVLAGEAFECEHWWEDKIHQNSLRVFTYNSIIQEYRIDCHYQETFSLLL